MTGLFRSEDMSYVRIIMSDESASATIRELGRFGRLHVLDLADPLAGARPAGEAASSAAVESSFTYYKKRIALAQFWEKKLLSFRDAFDQYRIALPDVLNPLEVAVDELRAPDIIEECRQYLEPIEEALAKNVAFRKQQKQQINEYMEYLYVLKYNSNNQFASNAFAAVSSNPLQRFSASGSSFGQLQEDHMESGGRAAAMHGKFTSSVCGVLPSDKIIPFERLLFRVSRGNALCNFFEVPQLIEDPVTNESVKKHVFCVTFMGEQLSRRIGRIVQYAGGTEYPLPSLPEEVLGLERDIQLKLQDANTVLTRTDHEIRELLSAVALDPSSRASGIMPYKSPYWNWLTALQRERHICATLKKCDQEGPNSKMITLEGWCPSAELDGLRGCLYEAVRETQTHQAALQVFEHPPPHSTPPTFFKANKFVSTYQGIVDTYGTPRYKEVNPGLFTIISFPFLFGIMYGDIGHGTLLLLFSLYLLFNESKFLEQERRGQLGEIPGMVFGGRYLLVLMGAFALYAGTIYNDCFSVPVHVLTSGWSSNTTSLDDFTGPYHYGVDPRWMHTTNELAFFNSFKMKLAVTLGVTQMTFGIILGALNNLYFGDKLAIFFEFIPRLVFILSTFGYMVFIIIYKMCVSWGPGTTPPLLIQTMIQMFLSPGSVKEENLLYEGQGTVQAALLLAAFFAVPMMLFPLPCITNHRNKKYLASIGLGDGLDVSLGSSASSGSTLKEKLIDEGDSSRRAVLINDVDESKESEASSAPVTSDHAQAPGGGHGDHALGADYDFSSHMIVQGIHTIEFVLGTVSNTASYLRLWALSLAHAELSSVFWDKMIMQYGVEGSNPFSAVVGFAGWAVATFAVLLCMDTLECFLHALRLHWVEFQNKFFAADGIPFDPFNFDNLSDESS